MNPYSLIEQYYPKGSKLYGILVDHGRQVAEKSLEIARGLPHLPLDLGFIEKAALLHDIGIFMTHAPSLGCTGPHPYICHGFLGRKLLDDQGWDQAYGLVAERHTGAGITLENITANNLPLPRREMLPVTPEEKIICCADKFFSKSPANRKKTMDTTRIILELEKISQDHAARFALWAEEFRL